MPDTKTCTRCGALKAMVEFPWCKDRRLLAGGRIGSRCKACVNEKAKEWQAVNYDRAFAAQKRWRKENKRRFNENMARASRMYASKRQRATPRWADTSAIAAVYAAAEAMRLEGRDVVVDHIVPLQGRSASGLHVHWNLQIIEKRDNQRKRNAVHPDAHHAPCAWDQLGLDIA